MQQIKIIFFDIDGTLIDMQSKHISPCTVEALHRLRANGIRLCIATGRAPVTLPDFGGVEFDAYLTFNGSLCYAGADTIYSRPINGADLQRLIQNAASLGRPVAAATRDRIAANGTDTDLADYFAIANEKPDLTADFDAVCRQSVYQLMLGCRAKDYPAILQGVGGAKIAAWWDRAVDVIPADGGKGIGIKKVLAYYGLDKSQALAFGDGNNDLEMLDAVGTGVAMANASPELKALADAVCPSVAEDGIWQYCTAHGLI